MSLWGKHWILMSKPKVQAAMNIFIGTGLAAPFLP